MLPDYNFENTEIDIKTQPSKTYFLDVENNRIYSYCDGIEAVKQAVYKILNTERYNYLIYDYNYGVELKELFGKPVSYVLARVKEYVCQALLADDRINEATDFEISYNKSSVYVNFCVNSIFGDFNVERSVMANV